MLSQSRGGHGGCGVPVLHVYAEVGNEVGGIQLRNGVVASGVDGVQARHDIAVQIEARVLSKGGVKQSYVVGIQPEDAALECIRNGLADAERGKRGWKRHRGGVRRLRYMAVLGRLYAGVRGPRRSK